MVIQRKADLSPHSDDKAGIFSPVHADPLPLPIHRVVAAVDLLEDCYKSNEPVRVRSPHFDVLEEFIDASYKERYEIFCQKLLLERQYSAACFTTTSFSEEEITYNFPREHLSFEAFAVSMLSAALSHFIRR